MMKIMALQVLSEVAQNIQSAEFYSLMSNEATEVSNVLQLVISLRWVDCDLVTHDEFNGLKDMPCNNAHLIVAELKDVLLRMNLKLNECNRQCYDGCSTMTGHRNGLVVQTNKKKKRALCTHCYNHLLNLGIGDTIENSALLKHTVDKTFELTNLVKRSTKKDKKLKEIQNSLATADDRDNEDYELNQAKPSISIFCQTR